MTGRNRMDRRRFIAATAVALAAPRVGHAQQPGKTHSIAILSPITPAADMRATGGRNWKTFFEELRRLGYIEGRNLEIQRHSADGDPTRLAALARAVVARRPDVVFVTEIRGALALKAETTTIPIVAFVPDPVRAGLASSLARPGGNFTGFSIDTGLEIVGKRIELLKLAVPTASRMAILAPRGAGESRFGDVFREVAQSTGLTLVEAPLDPPILAAEYRRAFAAMLRQRVDSIYVVPNSENYVNQRLIAQLAAEAGVPAIYPFREAAGLGGLMSYGVDVADLWRGLAGYVDQVLKGANPANMPFQQPTKFELLLNLKTAQALGITIPATLLARADEVIE